jgi:hypothetical protein
MTDDDDDDVDDDVDKGKENDLMVESAIDLNDDDDFL